jgi:hypothetical protein
VASAPLARLGDGAPHNADRVDAATDIDLASTASGNVCPVSAGPGAQSSASPMAEGSSGTMLRQASLEHTLPILSTRRLSLVAPARSTPVTEGSARPARAGSNGRDTGTPPRTPAATTGLHRAPFRCRGVRRHPARGGTASSRPASNRPSFTHRVGRSRGPRYRRASDKGCQVTVSHDTICARGRRAPHLNFEASEPRVPSGATR